MMQKQLLIFVQMQQEVIVLLVLLQVMVMVILDNRNAKPVLVNVLSQMILLVELMLEEPLYVQLMKKPLKLTVLLKFVLTKMISILIQIVVTMTKNPISIFVQKMIQTQIYQLVLTRNVLPKLLMKLGVEKPF